MQGFLFLLVMGAVTLKAVQVTAEEAGILLVLGSVSADTQGELFLEVSDGVTEYTLGRSSCWCLDLASVHAEEGVVTSVGLGQRWSSVR